MTKVVLNACFGGFEISREAAAYMARQGHQGAASLLDDNDDHWYGFLDTPRHDPILVKAVEALGKAAGGDCSRLEVVEIEGSQYRISEYEGNESIETPSTINWVEV